MNKSILCLFVIACLVVISYAFPAEESVKTGLEDSFGAVAQHESHEGLAHAEGEEQLTRAKRQFFGGYGGYGGYGGGYRRYGGYGGYGGYGFRRRGYGGYGGYGFYG